MKCHFKSEVNNKCSILTVKSCPGNCKFRKTEGEVKESREAARMLLVRKGLVPCEKVLPDGTRIKTVKKVNDCE